MTQNVVNLSVIPSIKGFKIYGADAGDNLGTVGRSGDVNGDGYIDLIIGARKASPNGVYSAGKTYIIFGKPNMVDIDLRSLTSSQGIVINGISSDDVSGTSVSIVKDVNNDGYDDILIGAFNVDASGRTNSGASYLIFGASTLTNIDLSTLSLPKGIVINGAVSYGLSGCNVNTAGDINNDGFNDFTIGAIRALTNGRDLAGSLYVVFGKSTFSNIDLASTSSTEFISIAGAAENYYSGVIDKAGDINGDGYGDVVIGAYKADVGSQDMAGTVYVLLGKASLSNIDLATSSSSYGFKITGINSYDYAGYAVSGAGDVNNDGYDDIIISVPGADPNGKTDSGAVYIIFGNNRVLSDVNLLTFSSSQGFKVVGASAGDSIGGVVSGAGDINNDGYDDVAIGAGPANSGAGIVYIIYGGPNLTDVDLSSLPQERGALLLGTNSNDGLSGVRNINDLNKDGYDDIIMGAQGADPFARTDAGIAYVLYGAESGFKTDSPTPMPTFSPTFVPSNNPTYTPTKSPSITPTLIPTVQPTSLPSVIPSKFPTYSPTKFPSFMPTSSPTVFPSVMPTMLPSFAPTLKPSVIPSIEPTLSPTFLPTALPTSLPTKKYDHDCSKVIDSSNLALSPFDDKVTLSTNRLFNIDCKSGNDEVVFHLNNSLLVDFFRESISVSDKISAFKNCEVVKLIGKHDVEVVLGSETIAVFGNNKTTVFHTDEENECIKLYGVTGHSFEFLSSAVELDLN